MADDIIPLRRSYVQTMVERISELEAENERLCDERDDLQVLLSGRTAEFLTEIERLRVEVAAWRDLDKERIRTIRQGNDFMLSQDAELGKLRAAGDKLAQGVLDEHQPFPNDQHINLWWLVANWQETRRG